MSVTNRENNWKIDNLYSEVTIETPHATASTVTGNFEEFEGNMRVQTENTEKIENGNFEFTAEVNSIETGNQQHNRDVKCDTYYDAEAFPKLRFKSDKIEQIADKRYKVSGDLTVKNTTKKVDLDMHYFGLIKDQHGNEKIAIDAKCDFDITDFDLKTGFDKDRKTNQAALLIKAHLRRN